MKRRLEIKQGGEAQTAARTPYTCLERALPPGLLWAGQEVAQGGTGAEPGAGQKQETVGSAMTYFEVGPCSQEDVLRNALALPKLPLGSLSLPMGLEAGQRPGAPPEQAVVPAARPYPWAALEHIGWFGA